MRQSLGTLIIIICFMVLGQVQAQEQMPPSDYVPYEKAPEVIKQVKAIYPEAARKDSAQGTVWVKVLIDESGNVATVNVVKSDNKLFDKAAIDAVKQWAFHPALMKGNPVAVWVTIPFRFVLADGDKSSRPLKEKRYPPAEDVKHDTEPELVGRVNPQYPPEALQGGLMGTVWTKMWVDESGKVVEVIVTKSENEVFNQASMDAGIQWVFKPALLNGKPVAVWVTVPFRFALKGN